MLPRPFSKSQPWFPPATLQMRARNIKSVFVKVDDLLRDLDITEGILRMKWTRTFNKISTTEKEDRLVAVDDHDVIWSSQQSLWRNEEFCSWVDIQSPSSGIQGFVLQLELSPSDAMGTERAGRVILARSVNLPRLHCLGSHAAPTTSNPGGDRVVFLLHGSYFAVRDADAPPETRHLFIGGGIDARHHATPATAPLPVTQSYDASLLTRLLRMHRAIKSQSDTNEQFKGQLQRRGVTDAAHLQEDEAAAATIEAAAARPENSRSLRQQVFSQLPKKPVTRLKELKLRAQIERLRLRNELYKNERERMSGELERNLRIIGDIRTQMNDANVVLTNKVHTMSKDKITFSRWEERLAANASYVFALQDVLHSCQLNVLHGFHFLFPIQNASDHDGGDHASKTATASIRWICLPRVEEAKGRSNSEMMLGVASGWVAEMLVIFSSVLDVPLRFPVRLGGSNSGIGDPSAAAAVGGNVFPLYLKGADATRAEYGLFIMQKNLVQLRWACGLPSNNYKATLKNLYELIMLKDRRGARYSSQDQLRLHFNPLSPPPGAVDSDVSGGASRTLSTPQVPEAPEATPSSSPSSPTGSTSNPAVVVPASVSCVPHGSAENKERNGVMSSGETASSTSNESSPTGLINEAGGDVAQTAQPKVAAGRTTERSSTSGNVAATSSFWGDVQSRTQALSVTTSFQRRKHVSNQH